MADETKDVSGTGTDESLKVPLSSLDEYRKRRERRPQRVRPQAPDASASGWTRAAWVGAVLAGFAVGFGLGLAGAGSRSDQA